MGKRDNLSIKQTSQKKTAVTMVRLFAILRFSKPRQPTRFVGLGNALLEYPSTFQTMYFTTTTQGVQARCLTVFVFCRWRFLGVGFCVRVCVWKSLKKKGWCQSAKFIVLWMKLNLRPKIWMSVIFHFPLVMLWVSSRKSTCYIS